jgi:hypothetical protein
MKKPSSTTDFSICLPGTLTVKKHTGTYRTFTVGELVTPLADFKVIDKWVEQLDAGTYEGDFWISRLEPTSRNWRTRVFIEIQARVLDYRLKEAEEPTTSDGATFPERDPLEDETPPPARTEVASKRPANARAAGASGPRNRRQQAGRKDDRLEQLIDLFGAETAELISAGTEPVKLDSTVDRQLLRQQIHFLREDLRYTLDLANQHWQPPQK